MTSYADAFDEHERRLDDLESWRLALLGEFGRRMTEHERRLDALERYMVDVLAMLPSANKQEVKS
jgi:hypothetical protein